MGNARIHSMTHITAASITYITTQVWMNRCTFKQTDIHVSQVRFALSSTMVFSWTNTVTDSEHFYNSVLDYFEDIDEQQEVQELLIWWNRYAQLLVCNCLNVFKLTILCGCRQIFPSHSSTQSASTKDSAHAIMKEKQALQKQAQALWFRALWNMYLEFLICWEECFVIFWHI